MLDGSGERHVASAGDVDRGTSWFRFESFLLLDRCNEFVPTTADRGYEARAFGVVIEGLTQFADGGIQAVIEVDKGVRRPEAFTELLAADHLARAFKKNVKNFKRAVLELNSSPVLAEFRPCEIGLVRSEMNDSRGR
jgi:hypothetical protein